MQDRPTADIAAVVNAVHAEAERSGTLVLAEGLETADHVLTARAYGATIGQGWHFARPGDLPAVGAVTAPTERETVRISPRRDGRADVSPFDAVARTRTPRAADKRLLIAVSKHLEAQAHAAGDSAIVLSAFQDVRFLTPATKRRYAALAESCAFVAALGEDVPADPLPGVRGGALTGRDPLLGEWDIAVLGPHFAACLVARDLGDEGPDMERRFEFVLSHDRELTIRVAGSMMTRVWPEPPVADLPQPPVTRVGALPGPRTPLGEATGTAALSEALPGHLLDAPLLQRALDAATTGITVSDARLPGQPLIWVNSAFARLSGQSADEVLGRNCRFLQGPGSDPRVIADISAAIAAGEGIHTRLLNYRQDGTPWWNEPEPEPGARRARRRHPLHRRAGRRHRTGRGRGPGDPPGVLRRPDRARQPHPARRRPARGARARTPSRRLDRAAVRRPRQLQGRQRPARPQRRRRACSRWSPSGCAACCGPTTCWPGRAATSSSCCSPTCRPRPRRWRSASRPASSTHCASRSCWTP
ncbi:hypothetical protein GCM10025868_41130 [Angustibacter aerolatus]|uniref:PAS domain-containing protein n=1 Tax=Angustibacter aerolatus TaxID=1162965 RepID=A0ABQ6JNB0_9ACTN|nr:hypothetical protein GCM10025868_41130 [Angustibacter aerolatus]